jgi:predicted metal-dependent enzyme (double-stranded beta helix superfamily)
MWSRDRDVEDTVAISDEIQRFVRELKTVTAASCDPRVIVERVRPLACELALSRRWLEEKHYECDPIQGFGAHLLYEEADHTLAIFAGAWLPGRGAPPHNHGTWAVVAGVVGTERNTLWTRVDNRTRPGHAELSKEGDRMLGPGDVLLLQPDSIHSVVNETESVTVSLHVYGRHVNHTERSRFDPKEQTERPFIITTA